MNSETWTSWVNRAKMLKARLDKVDIYKDQKYDKIKKQLTEQKCIFTDFVFPASRESVGSHLSSATETMEWKRPADLCEHPVLFDNTALITPVKGGELSSNWIVSALCVLAGVKELCYKIVMNYRDQEWDADSTDKYTGIFHFRFWRFGQWVEVVVDDLLPTVDGKLVFTHSLSSNEFWVSLLEKAYAKLLGSYDALEEGHVSDALVDMTGGVSEIVDLIAGDYDSNEERRFELLQTLTTEMADHSIMCASIVTHSQDEVGQRTEMGLVRGQAYHITAVKKIHLGDMKIRNLFKGREKVAMIRLRDPYGSIRKSAENSPTKSVASNPESDGDYAYSTSQLTRLLSKNPAWAKVRESDRGRIGLSVDNDAEFWMPVEDFVTNLGELTIIRLFNNNIFARGRRWKESALRGCWTLGEKGTDADRSGGGNVRSDTFFRNPQFLFQIDGSEEEVIIQMLQWNGVEASPSMTSTHHHRTLLIGFSIIKVEQNRKYRLHKLWPFCQTIVEVDHQRRRELYYRGFFPRGKYLLVATAYKPGAQGHFLIRMISQADVKLREVERDVPGRVCSLSCISSPTVWITVVAVKSAHGLLFAKNVYCSLKCENQKVKTQVSRSNKEMEWEDIFVFYRKYSDRHIVMKVYSHNVCMRDKFIGWAELPAGVNHTFAPLEVTLLGKDNNPLENAIIKLDVLTEDNLMAV